MMRAAEPVVFPGFVEAAVGCARCGARWHARRMLGAQGLVCPVCGQALTGFRWQPPGFAGFGLGFGHDGAWLVGAVFVPGALCQAPVTGPARGAGAAGWWARLRRLFGGS